MKSLNQTKWSFLSRCFELNDRGLSITENTERAHVTSFLTFEEIGDKIIESRYKGTLWLASITLSSIKLFFSVLGVLAGSSKVDVYFLFFAGVMAVSILAYLFFRRKESYLAITGGSSNVLFFLDDPKETEVKQFVNELLLKRKEFFRLKYGTIDKSIPVEEQLRTFKWLQSIDVISNEEFENLKNELAKPSFTIHPIGKIDPSNDLAS